MLSVMINLTSCDKIQVYKSKKQRQQQIKKATQYKNNQKMRKQTFKKSNNTKSTKVASDQHVLNFVMQGIIFL